MQSRLNRHLYFIEMLKLVAERSTCIRRKVGAIITDNDGHILSTGYNGVPRGFDHCIDTPCNGANDLRGFTVNCLAVHAEQNALLQCSSIRDATILYSSCTPCFVCAKMIANTKISSVFCLEEYADKTGIDVLRRAGIEVQIAETSA